MADAPPPEPRAQHDETGWTCRHCGLEHGRVALSAGKTARCSRCGAILAQGPRFGRDTTAALTLAALFLAPPSLVLPLVTAEKFGNERTVRLLSSVAGLWRNGMPVVAVAVLLFGVAAPLLLLGVLAVRLRVRRPSSPAPSAPAFARIARLLAHWAMPEVQVLAVLVSFAKLGSLVDMSVGPALWCYGAMSLAILAAWRSFDFDPDGISTLP